MSTCQKEELKLFDIALGIAIILGIVVGYIPQIYKLFKTKNSYGISPYARLICIVSQTFLVFNVFLLQKDVMICFFTGKLEVLYTLGISLGFLQVFFQWICVALIYYLFISYYPRHLMKENTEKVTEKQKKRLKKEWRDTIISIYVFTISFVTLTILSIVAVIMGWKKSVVEYIAGLFGLISALLAVFQYLPQIRKTYIDKAAGAVSIVTLLIQVPGALIMAVCLIIQPGTNWTSSTSYFVSFLLNGTVLVLCVYYTLRDRRRKRLNQNEENVESNKDEDKENFLDVVVAQ